MKRTTKTLSIQQTYLNSLSTDKELKAFALWLKLKGLYHKTIIYNFSVAKVSKKSGISPYIISKYLPILKEMGLVSDKGKHLNLTAFKKVMEKSKHNTHINIRQSYKGILDDLRFSFLVDDNQKQKFMYSVNTSRLQRTHGYSSKASIRLTRKYYKEGRIGFRATRTSYRRISRLCKVSITTAHDLVRKWKAEGKMKMESVYQSLGRVRYEGFTPHMTEYGLVTSKGNNLCVLSHSELTIL